MALKKSRKKRVNNFKLLALKELKQRTEELSKWIHVGDTIWILNCAGAIVAIAEAIRSTE